MERENTEPLVWQWTRHGWSHLIKITHHTDNLSCGEFSAHTESKVGLSVTSFRFRLKAYDFERIRSVDFIEPHRLLQWYLILSIPEEEQANFTSSNSPYWKISYGETTSKMLTGEFYLNKLNPEYKALGIRYRFYRHFNEGFLNQEKINKKEKKREKKE